MSLVLVIFRNVFRKTHTASLLWPQRDRAGVTKFQSLWPSGLSATTCPENNHVKARAGGFQEGPPRQWSCRQTTGFHNHFGGRMRHLARASDTDLVYQVAVTKSICFVSALFNKLFLLHKTESLRNRRKLNCCMMKVTCMTLGK